MPGKRTQDNADFVTPRRIYRAEVIAVDPTAENVAIPILDTRSGPNTSVGGGQSDNNQVGKSGQLNLAVLINAFTSVTLQIWQQAEVEQAELSSAPPPPAMTLPATANWMKTHEKVFTGSELWIVPGLSPGKLKVRVSAVVGAGQIQMLEQHAA
jgi:hypothetical protein